MFNWLFNKFQLEPPKLTREDVERSRKAPVYSPESDIPEIKIPVVFEKGKYDFTAADINAVDKPTGFVLTDEDAVKIFNALVDRNKKQIEERIGQTVESFSMGDFFKDWQKELDQPNCQCIAISKPKIPTIEVPFSDYEIMKIVRVGWALGEGTIHLPIEESSYTDKQIDETHFNNAKILHKFYGMSKDEIFQLTGCYLK